MAKIPEEALTIILKNDDVVLVGTVDPKGVPNVSPRFVVAVVEDEKLVFADAFKNKTYDNIKAWNRVTVAVLDRETMGGFQLKGHAEAIESDDLAEQATKKLKEHGIDAEPKAVWVLSVEEVYSLKPEKRSKRPISAYE